LSIAAENQQEMIVIPSWGDVTIVHGRGTDAAMDSPEAMAAIIKHWQGRGFTGVYLRTDLMQYDPEKVIRNSQERQDNAMLATLWKYVDSVMEKFPVHATMQREADKVGFKYWAYHPHLFSDGAPADVGEPGLGRMIPWSYCMKYTRDHPEVVSVDRKGNRLWMIREYAYPGARSSKVDEFVYMAEKHGLKRFLACLRSEVLQILPAPDKADQYGFNEPVANDMKTLFGVDIMTDPRFDVYSEDYDPHDPVVQNWYNLRGSYFTQFLRELRERLSAVDPGIEIAIPMAGDHVGPPMGNWRMDWRTWVDEGLVNAIVAPAFFEATFDKDVKSKGYLTNGRTGEGIVPFTVIKDYIKKSNHPEIKLISTGAPSYFYPASPGGTDGWRCDIWYDLYTMAWYQRWQQWKEDIKDFGHIKFFEQNFDTFPENHGGHAGGWGDGWHSPELRACEGCWYKLGDGTNTKPVTQSLIKHGDKGNAIKFTSSALGRNALIGRHASAPDRSTYTGCVDNAITNGVASFEFWLYRADDDGGATVYFQGDDYKTDVGLQVADNTGSVSYSNGGKWIAGSYSMPVGQWQKFTIKLDLDNQNYSAYAGSDNSVTLCSSVTYSVPESRFIAQHGVEHIKIEVPAYRRFSIVQIVPHGKDGSNVYLDDVSVKWLPTLHYTPQGDRVCFTDNFESYPSDATVAEAAGEQWTTSQDDPENCFIEHTTSYGEGVKCLRTQGGSDITANNESQISLKNEIVTVDFDIFIRSDLDFPYIFPNTTNHSDHTTIAGLRNERGKYLSAIRNGEGVWQYYDGGKFVDSKTSVAYDVWNHVQFAVDGSEGSYAVVVQPLGELPIIAGNGKIVDNVNENEAISFVISPTKSERGFSCYDNIVITY
jgi:hypothetical protein